MRTRRTLAALGVGVLLLGAMGANPAPQEGDGRAQTELQLLRLGLTDVPGIGDVESSLGTLLSEARTVDGSAAGLLLRGLEAAGTPIAERSYGDGDGGSESIALGDLGSVSLVDYLVAVDDRSATATLGALAGELDTGALGAPLLLSLGERGLASTVTEDGATSVTTVALPGVGLGIGDLLPDGLLDELPLGLLDELVGALPIDLPTDLDEALALLDEVIADLESLLALETDVLDAHDDLLGLLEVDTLEDALTDLDVLGDLLETLELEVAQEEALLASLGTLSLAGLLDLVTTLDADCDTGLLDVPGLIDCLTVELGASIADLTEEIAAVTTRLTAAEGLLDDLLGLLDVLDGLLDELTDLIGQLPDLGELRDDLADLLEGAELFGLGDLLLEVVTVADADAGAATVSCDLGEMRVLGEAARNDVDCSELDASFTIIEDVVGGLLDALPVELPAVVSVGGLDIVTGTDAPDDGERTATATVSALRAAVGSVGLDAIDDLLTGDLGDLLDDATGLLGDLDELGLLDPDLLDLLDGDLLGLASVGADVAALDGLTGLIGQVEGLPLGDGLDGLRTIGLDLEVAGIDALSGFQAADEPVTGDPIGDDPAAPGDDPAAPGTDPDDPGTVTPQPTASTTPTQPLPKTGGGLSLLGLGLLGTALIPRWGRA